MIASLAGLALAADPPPEDPYVFVADPAFTMEPGVRTALSFSRVAFLYDDALTAAIGLDLDESTPGGRALGVSGRVAKGLLLDFPLVSLENLLVHEVLGHGARAREAGLEVSYLFRLVPPYGDLLSTRPEDAPIASAVVEGVGSIERDLVLDAAGIEAEHAAAYWLEVGALRRDGWMHYSELLLYTTFKLAYVASLSADQSALPDPEVRSTNDVESYVTNLQRRFDRWRPAGRATIARRLRTAYLWNFADPTLWAAAWHAVATYGFYGERDARLPALRVRGWRVWPGTRFLLAPYGAEHVVDLFAARDGAVVDVYGRIASTGLASTWGVGGRALGVPVGPRGTVGLEGDLWRQPDLILDHRFVFDRPDRLGASGGLHLGWRLHERFGLEGKLAYKGEGFVMGLPLERGVHGYVGVSFAPTSEAL